MPLAADLRACMADASELGLGLPMTVVLESGAEVACLPGMGSSEDSPAGPVVVAGRDPVLRFVSADVPGLEAQSLLTWNGRPWRVRHVELCCLGEITRAFLGRP